MKKSLYFLTVFVCVYSLLVSCHNESHNTTKGNKSDLKALDTFMFDGDYQLTAKIKDNSIIYFTGSDDYGYRAYLHITENGMELRRVNTHTNENILLKRKDSKNVFPADLKILKNGNFFRFWVGDNTEWVRGPLGEWAEIYDPFSSQIFCHTEKGKKVDLDIIGREWMTQFPGEVVRYGEPGSFYEQQAIPGAILEYEGMYYLYFMAGMIGDEEGSSRRTIGLAKSKDLINWEVSPDPVVTYKDYPYDNLYINGVALTPDNKVGIMFSAQDFPKWMGLMLAVADHPEGKFEKCEKQPVYKHKSAAHEFDLIDMKEPVLEYDGVKYRYMLFYAGFTGSTSSYAAGDKGFIIYSNDLKEWVYREDNPLFFPETSDNWDCGHVRPRSLTKIGDEWYLWYEGCNVWNPPGKGSDQWCDVIGLARSKDLVNWEYHPRNPVLAGIGQKDSYCGSSWVGWPKMIIKDNVGYVFFCGTHDHGKVSITYRTIPIEKLTDWQSDMKN